MTSQGITADLGLRVSEHVYVHVCMDERLCSRRACAWVHTHDADVQVYEHRLSVWRPAQLPVCTCMYLCTHNNCNSG